MRKISELQYTLSTADMAHFGRSKGEVDKKSYYTVPLKLSLVVHPLEGVVTATIMLHEKTLGTCNMDLLPTN